MFCRSYQLAAVSPQQAAMTLQTRDLFPARCLLPAENCPMLSAKTAWPDPIFKKFYK